MEERPVALVTGASSGIGAATARALGGAGYAIALVARRQALLEQVAEAIRAVGGVALAVPTDVCNADQVAAAVHAVEATLGPITILVNNAGVGVNHRAWCPPDEVIATVLGTNLTAPIIVTRAVAPGMVARRRGHIITIGSVAAHVAPPATSLYNASKAGVRAWSLTLRRELQGARVQVSLISPGYIRTPLTAGLNLPMPEPDLVARTVLRLVRRPRREVVVPAYYRPLIWLERFAPGLVDVGLKPFTPRLR